MTPLYKALGNSWESHKKTPPQRRSNGAAVTPRVGSLFRVKAHFFRVPKVPPDLKNDKNI